ncbi:hypothetical protein BC567DRAFT_216982 [Phyllosticta citribraziliensis]
MLYRVHLLSPSYLSTTRTNSCDCLSFTAYSAVPGTQSLPSTPSPPPRTRPLPPHSKLSSLVPESRPQYPSPISLCTRLPFPVSAEWWLLLLEGKEKKEDGLKVEDDALPVLDVVVEGPWEGETWKTLRSQERVRWRREVLGAAVPAAGVVELAEGVGDGMVCWKDKMMS